MIFKVWCKCCYLAWTSLVIIYLFGLPIFYHVGIEEKFHKFLRWFILKLPEFETPKKELSEDINGFDKIADKEFHVISERVTRFREEGRSVRCNWS